MQIGIPAESAVGETRVAVTPETAKKLKAQGHTLRLQVGAGEAASAPDDAYAVIEASDVRPSVKEQVESLGAKFIDVPYETAEEKEAAEGVGGYARPMPQSWLERQKVEVAKRVAQADVVISTALIPGRPAPVLVTEEMVKSMKPGSVIVDIAAGKGPDLNG